MYIVIHNKITRRIVSIIDKKDIKKGITYGYSNNCAEVIVEEKPTGKFLEN